MAEKESNRSALLMVMTEAPSVDESEFHDWYDLEHIPEREAVDGFLKTGRYVCLDGWPRYMALYDLGGLDVLSKPAYSAISGANFSLWSKRIIANVRGWLRVEATQVLPGTAVTGAKGKPLRLALLRIVGAEASDRLSGELGEFLDTVPGLLQWRLFKATPSHSEDHYVIAEFATPTQLTDMRWSSLKMASGEVMLANMYTQYWRRKSVSQVAIMISVKDKLR